MLRAAIAFFILAIIAGVLGFGNMAGGFETIAKIFLLVFAVLFVLALVGGRRALGGPTV